MLRNWSWRQAPQEGPASRFRVKDLESFGKVKVSNGELGSLSGALPALSLGNISPQSCTHMLFCLRHKLFFPSAKYCTVLSKYSQ
jgi:hypothetical protein